MLKLDLFLFRPSQEEALVKPFDVASISLYTAKPYPSLYLLVVLFSCPKFPELGQRNLEASSFVHFRSEVGVHQNKAVDLSEYHVLGLEDILHFIVPFEEHGHHCLLEGETTGVSVEALDPDCQSFGLMVQKCFVAEVWTKYLIVLLRWALSFIGGDLLFELGDLKFKVELLVLQYLEALVLQLDFISNLLFVYFFGLLVNVHSLYCALLADTYQLLVVLSPEIIDEHCDQLFLQLDLMDGLALSFPVFQLHNSLLSADDSQPGTVAEMGHNFVNWMAGFGFPP